MQDRNQKALALRYAAGKHWFAQLEVGVLPQVITSATDKPITDIDVLILIPDEFDAYRALLVDCKTEKGEAPISRALWQRGAMNLLGAPRGICILKRDRVEVDHRHSAADFGVLLLTEADFERYVEASGVRRDAELGHAADLNAWISFAEIGTRYLRLMPAIEFWKSGYWMCENESEACRKTVALAARLKPELDPAKAEHMALVGDLASLFMLGLARLVSKVFVAYLQPASRAELSEALLLLIYNGREAYEFRNKILNMLRTQKGFGEDDLKLPEWETFLQLARQCLDAPTEVSRSPLIVREVAWSYLRAPGDLRFAKVLAAESPQAAKFGLLGVEYLCRAAKLPAEFSETLSSALLSIQGPSSQTEDAQPRLIP